MKTRDYGFDNLKSLIIILVVFAHLIGISTYGYDSNIYRIIYSFHMHIMFFISGFFAKFKKRRILNFFILYFVFQTIYISFYNSIYQDNKTTFQYTQPYYHLWYILVYLLFIFIIPLIDFKSYDNKKTIKKCLAVLFISLIFYFFIPNDKTIGYYLSLSRFFSFLPYFILGFYSSKIIENKNFIITKEKRLFLKLLFLVLAISSSLIIIYDKDIIPHMLYGAYPYKKLSYGMREKAIMLFCGLSWIGFLSYSIRINKRIPVYTKIGENTLTIFLLHGFIVKLLEKNNYLVDYNINICLIILLSIALVLLLGNKLMGYFQKYILQGTIIDTIITKIEKRQESKINRIDSINDILLFLKHTNYNDL